MKTPLLIGLLAIAAGIGTLAVQRSISSTAPVAAHSGGPDKNTPATRPAADEQARFRPDTHGSTKLPGEAAIRDVDVNGRIDTDPWGRLLYSPDLKDLFDHFLSMAGTREQIHHARDKLEAHIATLALDQGLAADVLSAFDRYVDYLNAAEQMAGNAEPDGDLIRSLQLLADLRRSVLGRDMADAFFAVEEAREHYLAEYQQIVADTALSRSDRSHQLEMLEHTLPADIQQARRNATAVIRLREEATELRLAGADDNVILYLREQAFGHEAAVRLQTLDQQRADWQARLRSYQAQRDALMDNPGLADQDRTRMLTDLRMQYFSDSEIRRVTALDRVAADGG